MLTISRLVSELECSLCQKSKDGCVAGFSDERGESVLCWACLKKMANRKMRLSESKANVPTATPVSAQLSATLERARQGNGPTMATPVK